MKNWKTYRNPHYFRFWCQKVLPLVYDDSLSYYELLCKVVRYLNDLIYDLDAVKDNLDELSRYIESLDFTDEVRAILREMLDDGLFDDFLATPITLNWYRVGRYCHELHAYGPADYTQLATGFEVGAEGFCIVNGLYCVGFKSSDDSKQKLIFFNSDFIKVRESGTYTTLGHINSLCFDGTYIYCATEYKLMKIDPNTLIDSEIPTPLEKVTGVAYDPKNNIVYFTDDRNVYKLEDETPVYVCEMKFTLISNAHQGFGAYGGYLYHVVSGGEAVLKFSAKSGNLLSVMNIPETIGIYATGEVQDLDIDEYGNITFNSTARKPYYQYSLTQFFTADINGLNAPVGWLHNNIGYRSKVYVDSNNYQKNPNGSAAHPFNNLDEALIAIMTPHSDSHAYTLILNSGSDFRKDILFISGVPLEVTANGNTVKSVIVDDCPMFVTHNLNVVNDTQAAYHPLKSFYITQSNAVFTNITISTAEIAEDVLFYESNITIGEFTGANSITADYSNIQHSTLAGRPLIKYLNCLPNVGYSISTALRNAGESVAFPDIVTENLDRFASITFFGYVSGFPNLETAFSTELAITGTVVTRMATEAGFTTTIRFTHLSQINELILTQKQIKLTKENGCEIVSTYSYNLTTGQVIETPPLIINVIAFNTR